MNLTLPVCPQDLAQSLIIPPSARPIILITRQARQHTLLLHQLRHQARGPLSDIATICFLPDAFEIIPTSVLYHKRVGVTEVLHPSHPPTLARVYEREHL